MNYEWRPETSSHWACWAEQGAWAGTYHIKHNAEIPEGSMAPRSNKGATKFWVTAYGGAACGPDDKNNPALNGVVFDNEDDAKAYALALLRLEGGNG